jgi:hypothetical protein
MKELQTHATQRGVPYFETCKKLNFPYPCEKRFYGNHKTKELCVFTAMEAMQFSDYEVVCTAPQFHEILAKISHKNRDNFHFDDNENPSEKVARRYFIDRIQTTLTDIRYIYDPNEEPMPMCYELAEDLYLGGLFADNFIDKNGKSVTYSEIVKLIEQWQA